MKNPYRLPDATWSDGGKSEISLEHLPSQLDGYLAHVAAFSFDIKTEITTHASSADSGKEFALLIDRLEIRDRLGNVAVNLKGHMLRTVVKLATGKLTASDPSDFTAGGTDETRYGQVVIPFHGGDGGVLGFRKYSDLLQPADRFRLGSITIYWAASSAPTNGTIKSGTVETEVMLEPRSELVQGADLRWDAGSYQAGSVLEVPLRGARVVGMGIFNPDEDVSDYTAATLKDLSLLNNARPRALIRAWNHAACTGGIADGESRTAAEFLPLVFMHRNGKLLDSIGFGKSSVRLETTTSHATTQWWATLELHNTAKLARDLRAVPQTAFFGRGQRKPRFADKNGMNVEAGKRSLMGMVAAQKMVG